MIKSLLHYLHRRLFHATTHCSIMLTALTGCIISCIAIQPLRLVL